MNILTKRQEELLKYLIYQDRIIPGKKLAEHFNVTSRTIRNDISVIESILNEESGIEFSSFRGKGYQVSIIDKYKLNKFWFYNILCWWKIEGDFLLTLFSSFQLKKRLTFGKI
ncbi:MAG: HTH domain-containing protein [Enterococcus avium]